jgi:hypothetical protein
LFYAQLKYVHYLAYTTPFQQHTVIQQQFLGSPSATFRKNCHGQTIIQIYDQQTERTSFLPTTKVDLASFVLELLLTFASTK